MKSRDRERRLFINPIKLEFDAIDAEYRVGIHKREEILQALVDVIHQDDEVEVTIDDVLRRIREQAVRLLRIQLELFLDLLPCAPLERSGGILIDTLQEIGAVPVLLPKACAVVEHLRENSPVVRTAVELRFDHIQ